MTVTSDVTATATATATCGVNVIANGEFANGIVAPWTTDDNGYASYGIYPPYSVSTNFGFYSMDIEMPNAGADSFGTISQVFPTVVGMTYDLSYKYYTNAETTYYSPSFACVVPSQAAGGTSSLGPTLGTEVIDFTLYSGQFVASETETTLACTFSVTGDLDIWLSEFSAIGQC